MITDMEKKVNPDNWPVTQHVVDLETSIIREILKLTAQPGVISFAGGLPAPELFPLDLIKEMAGEVIDLHGAASVQYSLSQGILPLRQLLADRATERGTPSGPENILITSGAQQGIELLARAFVEPGDYVLTENPTYVGALQAFNYYRARYVTVDMDEDGMIVDQVEEKIRKHRPKLIYTVSNFQNPTGISMSLERRKQLVEIAAAHDVPVMDDSPYGDIRFSGEPIATLKSLGGDQVVALRTFSKTFAPGLRIGWMNGPASIIKTFEKVKQCADLHTPTFNQYLLYEFVKRGHLETQIERLKVDYCTKRDVMLGAMREHFPDGISWTEPEGGLFLWVTLPDHLSAKDLLDEAIALKVAYVYGAPFFANHGGENTLRLNFSNAGLEDIVTGIQRLAGVFSGHM